MRAERAAALDLERPLRLPQDLGELASNLEALIRAPRGRRWGAWGRLRLRLRCRGDLVGQLVGDLAELAHRLADRPSDLGQTTRPEDDQHDDEDDHEPERVERHFEPIIGFGGELNAGSGDLDRDRGDGVGPGQQLHFVQPRSNGPEPVVDGGGPGLPPDDLWMKNWLPFSGPPGARAIPTAPAPK